MNHLASPQFWKVYHVLPKEVRSLADANFELLKRDSKHPSLHLKKVRRFWSVRVGRKHRALAVQRDSDLVWFWIGNHAQYDRLIK